jgi:cell division protein FtsI/penicillin-binding protein 2
LKSLLPGTAVSRGFILAAAVVTLAPLIGRAAEPAARTPKEAAPEAATSVLDTLSSTSGLDGMERLLAHARYDRARGAYYAPIPGGGEAELSLDNELQTRFKTILQQSRLEAGAIVAMDPKSGRVLGLAESSRSGEKGAALNAAYPAASVFKIVTAAALLEKGIAPEQETCFHGGFHRIYERNLRDDPRRDRRCASLADAMGKSLNVVFGKLAAKELSADQLRAMASRFFFNQPLPLVPEPTVDEALVSPALIPDEPLEFDRTAAGFGHVFLSPMHGAVLASIIGNGGVATAPRLIDAVWKDGQRQATLPSKEARVIEEGTAVTIGNMMRLTVLEGTARKAFRIHRHWALGSVAVAGKTGTLDSQAPFHDYSWFVGFAPAQNPTIAVAVVAVNGRRWTVKAPVVAREALQAHFDVETTRRSRADR